MSERLVTVARFTDSIEAELAKQRLEDFGIRAVLVGQNVANVCVGVPAAIDLELQTLEHDADRAIALLRQQGRQED